MPATNVLHVESDPSQRRRVAQWLSASGADEIRLEAADRLTEALERVRTKCPDLAITNLLLSDGRGLDTYRALRDAAPQLPIVILTDLDDEALAVQALQAGAQDYLLTRQVDGGSLARAVRSAVERMAIRRELQNRERHLGSIFRAAPIGIGLERGGVVVEANDRLCGILDYRREEIVGRPVRGLFPDDAHGARFPGAADGEDASSATGIAEMTLRRRDGTLIDVLVSSTRLHPSSADDAVTFCVLDLTDARRAAEALRTSEASYQAIFDNSNDAIFVHDLDTGAILDVNRATIGMFGWSRDEITALDVGAISSGTPPFTQTEALAWLARAAAGEPQTFDWLARDKSGREFWVEVQLKRATIGAGERLLAIVRDISERKRAEDEIHELNLSLERRVEERTAALTAANEELEAFAYSVSHDLRGPLRAIDGFARILADDYGERLDTEGMRLLGVVRENTGLMAHLIEDLLELSRVGRHALEPTTVDMAGIVASVVRDLRHQHPAWEFEIDVAALPGARVDAGLMRLVWANLLGNAAKFSRHRCPGRITVEGRVDNGRCAYSVRDNGVGFDMRYVHKLFGLFQRLHSSEEFEGTGVGLAIARRIVERHDGDITAVGTPGEGATFCFTVPADGGANGAPQRD